MRVGLARLQGWWKQVAGRLADERRRAAAGCLWAAAVAGVALAVYGPHLYTRPDGFDESTYIRLLGPLGWRDTGRWCTSEGQNFPYFRPLGFLSLLIDRQVWDRPHVRYRPDGSLDADDLERQVLDPVVAFPYRLTNLVIFAGSCVAFGLMLGRLGSSRLLGALAGLVYAAAPDNRITVLYYPERFILLSSRCVGSCRPITSWGGSGTLQRRGAGPCCRRPCSRRRSWPRSMRSCSPPSSSPGWS